MAEATYIANWNNFRSENLVQDKATAFLADVKLGANITKAQLLLTAEMLATSGAKGAADTATGNRILRKRAAFHSPVGAAYLMNIATNDGVDEAVGTPKQTTIANLGLDEGLRLLVTTATWAPSSTVSTYLRYGMLRSAAASAQNSDKIGSEWDLGASYQLSRSATLYLDYGRFTPGAFYAITNRQKAELTTLRYKFSF